MATKIRCDNCKKVIHIEDWLGVTHTFTIDGREKEFDICQGCQIKLNAKLLKIISEFFGIEGMNGWRVIKTKGSDNT